MTLNRRQVIVGVGTVLGAAGVGTALADEHTQIGIAEIFPVADVIILENTGDEAIDLGGYTIDWESANDDYNQTDGLEDATLEPGEQISVWTGFQAQDIPDVEADMVIGDYGNGRINASEADVIGLLDPDGELVDEAEYNLDGQSYADYLDESDSNGDDDTGGNDDNGDDDEENGDDSDGGNDDSDGSSEDEDC